MLLRAVVELAEEAPQERVAEVVVARLEVAWVARRETGAVVPPVRLGAGVVVPPVRLGAGVVVPVVRLGAEVAARLGTEVAEPVRLGVAEVARRETGVVVPPLVRLRAGVAESEAARLMGAQTPLSFVPTT